jgi:hypothetical protein
MISDLISLQRLVYSAITAQPPSAEIAATVPRVISGDERLTALRRIAIYADAYFYRLLDCLKEDFPATLAVVGEAEFQALIRSYLVHHPPTQPSIFHAARYLADFVGVHELRQRWPFLADLARLERTLIEVFHAPDAEALTPDELRDLAPADWPELRVRTIPALQMLSCEWRVGDVLHALKRGTSAKLPAQDRSSILVWRQESRVYFRELEAKERAALEAASRGASFAAVCEAFASQLDGEDAAAQINQTLIRWLADGLLMRPPRSSTGDRT